MLLIHATVPALQAGSFGSTKNMGFASDCDMLALPPPRPHTTPDTRTATPRQTHSHPSHAVDTAIVESQLAENGGRLPGNLQSGAVIASFSLPIGSAFGKPFERSGRKMRRSSSLVLHHEVAAHPSTCCGYALRMVAWLHLRHAFCFCCGELIAVMGF